MGRVVELPKKKEADVEDVCLFIGPSWDGRKGGGAFEGEANPLFSSATGEKPLPGIGRLIVGKTPPLPSGTPLNSPA